MCHSDESRPPAAPGPYGELVGTALELTASDGTRFAAYQAVPAAPNGRNIVVLPDVRGLHTYYRDLADRFAEVGFHATTIDYFGRTAGPSARDDDFDWLTHIRQTTPENVAADVGAALDQLRELNPGPTFTVGFCFGGSQSWRLAASELDLAGVIGFYGRPDMVADVVDDMRVPLLLLLAGADFATPPEQFDELVGQLSKAGKDAETHVYEGAPHSFFDRSAAEWREACDDAWRRLIAFTERCAAAN